MADHTDEELDLLIADLKAKTGTTVNRAQMNIIAALIPDDYLDRLRKAVGEA